MRAAARLSAAVTALVLGAGAVGCGGGSPDEGPAPEETTAADPDFVALSADEIRDRVLEDMTALESLTLSANFTNDGEELTFELSLDTDGTCAGTMAVGDGTAEILSVDGTSYLRGDEAFWEATTGGQGAIIASMVGDRWAAMPTGQGGFESVCDLDALLEGLDTAGDAGPELTKGEEQEIDGEPALELRAEDDRGASRLWVATSADGHYILRLEREGGDAGMITLSDFDEPVDVEVPDEDQVVDLSDLEMPG